MFFSINRYSKLIGFVSSTMLLVVSAHVIGAPAPWYIWKSKTAGHIICRQSYPGEGWLKISVPYTSSQCGKHLRQMKIGSTTILVEPKEIPMKGNRY